MDLNLIFCSKLSIYSRCTHIYSMLPGFLFINVISTRGTFTIITHMAIFIPEIELLYYLNIIPQRVASMALSFSFIFH